MSEMIARPENELTDVWTALKTSGDRDNFPDQVVTEQLEIRIKYQGYIDRQLDEIAKLKKHENTRIPESFEYSHIAGLSNELKMKLQETRPESIGRVSRIPGITPAAVSLLLIQLKKFNKGADSSGREDQENISTAGTG